MYVKCVTCYLSQAPIFLQWLFCMAQVVQASPHRFGYSVEDLGDLADLALSGWTGSLGCNSERQRHPKP